LGIPIQVDRRGQAGFARGSEQFFVPAVEHRFGEPDVGPQQVLGAAEGAQVQGVKAEGGIVGLAAQEMTLATVEDEVDGAAGGEARNTAEVTANPLALEDLLKLTSQRIVAHLAKEGDFRSEPGRDGRAVGPATADGFVNRREGRLSVAEEVLARREWSGLHVAVDVADDHQLGTVED